MVLGYDFVWEKSSLQEIHLRDIASVLIHACVSENETEWRKAAEEES